ncbi:MAG TPA: 2Fe-2S iron-sulfur cluster-binding protein [Myxococcota bacterium]|nr:2Fe-2S iron-sulfur cluster-binding protein [Myxococcota bacterium]
MAPRVRFLPSERSVTLEPGDTLLDAARKAGLPIAGACGAEGLCGRCGLLIVRGAETLPPESDQEARAKRRNRVEGELRLACRVVPAHDLDVTARYW